MAPTIPVYTLDLRPTEPNLRNQSAADWPTQVFSTAAGTLDGETVTFEHGRLVVRGGAGTGARSNRRVAQKIPGSPGGYSRVLSRLSGPVVSGATLPQWGHLHGVGLQADGNVYGVIVWTDIVINSVLNLNYGIWRAEGGAAGSFSPGGLNHYERVTFTDGSRTSNTVVLTGVAPHTFRQGDLVTVDASDNTYDGVFEVLSVTADTITYWQVAANDTNSGPGSVTPAWQAPAVHLGDRSVTVESISRTDRIVNAVINEPHALSPGDVISVDMVDNSYDGNFVVRQAVLGQVSWYQNAANAGTSTGTISKRLPYWLESEWLPGNVFRVRAWPDNGIGAQPLDTSSGAGAVWDGKPPWESPGSFTVNLATSAHPVPDPARGTGCYLLAAHLSGGATPTEVRYDNVETVVRI